MPKTRPPYSPEFRRQMVELVRSGRDPTDLPREFEPSAQAIRNWVAQSDRQEGRREEKDPGLTAAELDELTRLRRENRRSRRHSHLEGGRNRQWHRHGGPDNRDLQSSVSRCPRRRHTVTAEEPGANGSPPVVSPNFDLTVDTTPPSASSTPVLADASDSGVKGDNITSDNSPTLTGTAEADDTVNLYIGDNQIGSGTADLSGPWSIATDPGSLAEGINGIIAIATDPAGNSGPSSPPLVVTLDTTAPGAPANLTLAPVDETGAPGDNTTGNNLPTVIGTAEPGDTVALYDGGTQIGSGVADESGGWSITASAPLTEGSNSLTTTATDPAGNVSSDSSPLSVTLNAAPKDFVYTVPATGEAGAVNGDAYSGPVSYLQEQYLYGGANGVAIATATPNVFLHGGPGDDALAVSAGRNVLDGGAGSNFLTGGTGADGGTDTFFDDGRSGQTVWDTIVNFHQGDAAVIWGFNKDVSTLTWGDNEGAAGFQGATLHSELGGAGTGVNASITFSEMSAAQAQANFTISTGTTADGNAYLHVQHT